MFKNKLLNILKDLNNMKSSNQTFYDCVSKRLDSSLEMYYANIDNACKYLLSRNNYKVMRTLNKEKEKEDKLKND